MLSVYVIVKNMISQPLTRKSKHCALDLKIRFKIFNLALIILKIMRIYTSIFKSYADVIEFQYQAYLFIWQYFRNKNKYCPRNSGELFQNDIALLKETIEVNYQ
jgi:hypothetical protein